MILLAHAADSMDPLNRSAFVINKSSKMKPFTTFSIVDIVCSGPYVAVFTES